MLKFYSKRSSGEGYQLTTRPHEYTTWVHAESVTDDDLKLLSNQLRLNANIIRDVRDVSELPRAEFGAQDQLYIFLRIPRLSRRNEVHTSPLLIVMTKERFYSMEQGDTFQPDKIINILQDSSHSTPKQLALLTIAEVIEEYETLIHRTSRAVRDVGYRLRTHEVTNKDFVRFVTIEDNLNEYSTNLDGMLALAQHLRDNRRGVFTVGDVEMIDDIVLHIQQLLVAVGSQHQSIESIRNAYSTIANNTLNQRMKTLTVLTVLIALPNVFYGMYGMNVALPFAHEPWAYAVVVLFTFILIIFVYFLARRFKLF